MTAEQTPGDRRHGDRRRAPPEALGVPVTALLE
jgi:hypothetical protein